MQEVRSSSLLCSTMTALLQPLSQASASELIKVVRSEAVFVRRLPLIVVMTQRCTRTLAVARGQ